MQIVVSNQVKFEGVVYAVGTHTVTDDLGLRMVKSGVATKKYNLSQERPASLVLNDEGATIGIKGADFVQREQMKLLPHGQPQGITRPVTKKGKKVIGFASSDGWWLMNGTEGTDVATTNDYTGMDPTTGAVTGIVSRTGATKLRKMEILTNNTVQIGKTSGLSVALNGRIGLWVYVECPDSFTGVNLTLSLNGNIDYNFNNNQVKPNAWNFLVAVRSANPTSNTDNETHPFGLSEAIYTYASANWVTGNTTGLRLYVQNMAGATLYFDSVWTGWEAVPQFVLGADMTGSDTINYVLPKFAQYGWKGYIAEPFRVQTGGWADVLDWNTMTDASRAIKDAVYLAGWDIINHSVNHQAIGTYTDPAQIRYEIEGCRAWLETYNWVRGSEFYASPTSSTSMLSRRVIEAAGIKLQRHGTHDANHVTSFGIDEPRWVGSVDIGGNGWIYNGADPAHYPYAYPHIQNLRTWVDMIIKYQATGMPFWHGVKTLGDPGDGTGNSGDSIQMFKSTFDLIMDYIAEKEAAGLCRVTDGMTGFYYGVGR